MKRAAAATRGAVKSKIAWLGLAVVVLGFLEANKAALAPYIPEQFHGLADMALGLGIIVARFFTSATLIDKGTKANETAQE